MRHVAICLLVISVAGCGGDPSDPKTLFEADNKDHELIEEYIRKEIDKPEGELTKEDLLKVESLTLPGRPRAISDIGPLRGLVNLKRGSLQHNDIEDLTPLYGMKNLSYIFLNDNPPLTMDDINGLKEALPHCNVAHSIK